MASVTQNKQVPYFQCGPLKNVKKKKIKKGLVKTIEIVRQIVNKMIGN